jgi:hypothetical protein
MTDGEKKIIVDEDWKAKVEAEREALKPKPEGETPQETAKPRAKPSEEEMALPPASLSTLITSLAMQAMVSMGVIGDGSADKPEVHLELAKHLVDTLAVLEEKTAGNRTQPESDLLDNMLHELRMAYVAVSK